MEAHRVVHEDLVTIAAWEADRVRDLIDSAVARRDAETVRREGHQWSGRIGLVILELADRIEEVQRVDEFVTHLASQDPEHLEADRAEAWGGAGRSAVARRAAKPADGST
ncbi:hypothetical protein IEJ02_11320 [Streptomyces sp. 5-10]|nr:hypothetical protein [Streptomyces sp. 5-10]